MSAWDRFNYQRALLLARQDSELSSAHAHRLAILCKAASLQKGGETWPKGRFTGLELVEDLLDNANRYAQRFRFDDAVSRLYRATELLAQTRLLRIYGIWPGKVALTHPRLPETARAWLEAETGNGDAAQTTVKIGLVKAYRLLADLDDPLGGYYRQTESWLLNALSKRNDSLLAHGLDARGSRDLERSRRKVDAMAQGWDENRSGGCRNSIEEMTSKCANQ